MITIYVYTHDTMADWEIGHVTAELHSGRFFKQDAPKVSLKTVGISKEPVTSMGGLTILPDCVVDDIAVSEETFLLLPGGKKTTQKSNAAASAAQTDYAAETERRLTQMLQQIAGAGQVSVMLTLETGERVEYQTDVQASSDGAQSSESRKTVILSEGSSYDKAAVAATTYPRFQGALIVCEGADSAAVRLRLLEAVSAVTGLSTDRITVVKMRS